MFPRFFLESGEDESYLDLIKDAIYEALHPEFGEYENLGLTTLTLEKIRVVVIAFFVAAVVATYVSVFNKGVYGRLITRLCGEGCFSPEKARTLGELGVSGNYAVRLSLVTGKKYRGLVRCPGKDVFDDAADRDARQLTEDGEAPGRIKRPRYKFDFERDRFYIPQDKAIEAESLYDRKGSGVVLAVLVTVAAAAGLAGAIFLLPDVIQLLDNFVGILRG